jgi:hypothetical protein
MHNAQLGLVNTTKCANHCDILIKANQISLLTLLETIVTSAYLQIQTQFHTV